MEISYAEEYPEDDAEENIEEDPVNDAEEFLAQLNFAFSFHVRSFCRDVSRHLKKEYRAKGTSAIAAVITYSPVLFY